MVWPVQPRAGVCGQGARTGARGIPVLAAVPAPSPLAVELAGEPGMILVGFLRGSTMNVRAGGHRLSL
jgi:formate dehydrogenase assembly factor FdhD